MWPALFLAGCNSISGIDRFIIEDDSGSDPLDASDPSPVDAHDAGEVTDVKSPDSPDTGTLEDTGPRLHVFVTSTKTKGSFGGLSGGDIICNERASDAGRSGSWVAWLSTSSSLATARLTSNGPWYRYDGVVAVASRTELTNGKLSRPINVDELGGTDIADGVWTGTSASGTAEADCTNWNVNSCIGSCPTGRTGRSDLGTGGWTDNTSTDCLGPSLRLYCFEN